MKNIAETGKSPAPQTAPVQPKEPKEVHLVMIVCSCYRSVPAAFVTDRAKRAASILGISVLDLECAVAVAQLTGRPEVVARYRQRDVAEHKLLQLNQVTPFLRRSCHEFRLICGGQLL